MSTGSLWKIVVGRAGRNARSIRRDAVERAMRRTGELRPQLPARDRRLP
jgi:hypothetical protein